MQNHNSLFYQVTDVAVLRSAFVRVQANRGCAGIDGETIDEFAVHLDENLLVLQCDLRSSSYQPSPLRSSRFPKKTGGHRCLAIPTIRDRVVQTAACLVLTPLFDQCFKDCSFGYREGYSVEMAVQRIVDLRNEGFCWVLDGDIRSFFDKVNHELLLCEIRKIIADENLIRLVQQWLVVAVENSGKTKLKKIGLAQGSPISPLLSNLYLNRLDHAIDNEVHPLVRFADDFVILTRDRETCQSAIALTSEVLSGLKLSLNRTKTRLTSFGEGFDFLGYHFSNSSVRRREDAGQKEQSLQWRPKNIRHPWRRLKKRSNPRAARKDTSPSIQPIRNTRAGPVSVAGNGRRAMRQSSTTNDVFEAVTLDPLLRTLYVKTQGTAISKRQERFIISTKHEVVREVPAVDVDQIFVFGNVCISTPALRFCMIRGIPVILLSNSGRYFGSVEKVGSRGIQLQAAQFRRAADPEFCLVTAKEIVFGKIANSRLLLRRHARTKTAAPLRRGDRALKSVNRQVHNATTLEQLRGLEGAAAKEYFNAIRSAIHHQWRFSRRERRPPPDPVNAVLSYLYTLLFYNIYGMVCAAGLNPNAGFLHAIREGHPALVSDLIEEFRAIVVDAVVWPLFLNNQLTLQDFQLSSGPKQPCLIQNHVRKRIISAFEKKMNAAIINPDTRANTDYRRLMAYRTRAMVRAIRGQMPYKALLFK